ncbi:MAG TPA: hypothetical protein VNG69_04600 [Casimicrobiaceae bacterium]|nr:hypothetical protein [Casimicrobiaceae bacterium]
MSPKSFFRTLVGLSLATTFAISAAAIWPIASPEEWKSVLEWSGNGGVLEQLSATAPTSGWRWYVFVIVLSIALALVTAVQVGMFVFWRFARFGYVVLTAFFLTLTLLDGLVVMTPVEAALYEVTLVLDGVTIAMSYLPPIARYFERCKA